MARFTVGYDLLPPRRQQAAGGDVKVLNITHWRSPMIRTLPRRLALALSLAVFAAGVGAQTTPTASAPPQAGFFAHLLQKLDTDGDGRISEAEWLAAATARFKQIDTQNSGSFNAATLA